MFRSKLRLSGNPAVVRDDALSLPEEPVGDVGRLLHQTAWIVAQIENQSVNFRFTQLRQSAVHLAARVLVELLDLNERDARPDPIGVRYAVPGHLVSNDIKND